jgi:hypothetical protein
MGVLWIAKLSAILFEVVTSSFKRTMTSLIAGLEKSCVYRVNSALRLPFVLIKNYWPPNHFFQPPTAVLNLQPWDQDSKTQLCKPCLDSLIVAYEKARQELWDDLPSYFGLPPWEELKDFDT